MFTKVVWKFEITFDSEVWASKFIVSKLQQTSSSDMSSAISCWTPEFLQRFSLKEFWQSKWFKSRMPLTNNRFVVPNGFLFYGQSAKIQTSGYWEGAHGIFDAMANTPAFWTKRPFGETMALEKHIAKTCTKPLSFAGSLRFSDQLHSLQQSVTYSLERHSWKKTDRRCKSAQDFVTLLTSHVLPSRHKTPAWGES